MSNKMTIAVTGNPNCGKTTLFNALTGSSQYVGNWPGVTVEQKSGVMKFAGAEIEVVDTPGIYSMTSFSIDEKVTRDYILSGQADVVLNIIDATNVERSLYLLTQLLEMRVPVVVALNMMDAARRKKIKIEIEHFALHLGCPVVPIVASLDTHRRKNGRYLPIADSTDFPESSLPKLPSVPIEFKKLKITTIIIIALPARKINTFSRCHVWNKMPRAVGI